MNKTKKIVIITIVILLLLFILTPMIIAVIAYEANFGMRVATNTNASALQFEDFSFQRKDIHFSSNKNQTLKGYVYYSEKITDPKALIVLSHGYLGTHVNYLNQIDYFVQNGFLVLAYDNTGSGISDGANLIGLAQSPIDLDYALRFVESKEELNKYPILLYGHSWGGYAVSAVLNYSHSVAGVVSRSGFSNSRDMLVEYGSNLYGTAINVLAPYVYVYEKMKFGSSVDKNGLQGINHSTCPILLLHSEDDEVISLKNSLLIHKEEYTHPKRIQTILYTNKTHDVVKSDACLAYEKDQDTILESLIKQYGSFQDIPQEVIDSYYQKQDKQLLNQLDKNVMNSIKEFFESCL